MTADAFDPGPLAVVERHGHGDKWTLVFVYELGHPPAEVWKALTEPPHLAEWAPFVSNRYLGSVGEATLTMIDGDTKEDLSAMVLRAEPPTLLEYTWGHDLLHWELAPTVAGTRLTLRHTVGEEDLLSKVAAGWHLCLVVAARRMDGQTIGPIRGHDAMNYGWQELNDAYAEKLAGRG
jgi:uncharacterized protein YndB with AHSA1/START domain